MSDMDEIQGTAEVVSICERVVVSPRKGRFRPLPPETFTTEGEWASEGQALGEIDCGGESVPVISAFSGWVMGMIAIPGPVNKGESLFRIRP